MSIVRQVQPANGGVLLSVHPNVLQSETIGAGQVVAVGHGVPWLTTGDTVSFRFDRGIPYEVPLRDVQWRRALMTSDDPETLVTVWLVDQRDVLAKLTVRPETA